MGLRIMFEGQKLFLELYYIYNIFTKKSYAIVCYWWVIVISNIGSKLELVTAYHIGLFVKLL